MIVVPPKIFVSRLLQVSHIATEAVRLHMGTRTCLGFIAVIVFNSTHRRVVNQLPDALGGWNPLRFVAGPMLNCFAQLLGVEFV